MKLDADIEPLVQEMTATMSDIQSKLLPLFDRLDEDMVIANYSPDEQARIYLSAAFTMALSLYSVDKLSHRSAPAPTGKRAAAGSTASSTTDPTVSTGVNSADAQLVLKIERITDYIKKLRDITQLSQSASRTSPVRDVTWKEDAPKRGSHDVDAEVPVCSTNDDDGEQSSDAPRRKRARSEDNERATASSLLTIATTTTRAASDGEAESAALRQAADAKMFALVTRKAGETGTAVGRLLRHVGAPPSE